MAEPFKDGDRVQIVDREQNADDIKSSLFFNHYRGLVGTVQKVYATGEVAVDIELSSLPDAVAHRHSDVQEQMKTKWLDGLSEEARNRLSDKEKDFLLHYIVLVGLTDLIVPDGKPRAEEEAPRRRTSAEIEAEEEAYLQQRKQQG